MKFVKFLEEKFWLPLIISMFLGLFLPSFGKHIINIILPLVMILVFFTSLKIDFWDIISHIKKPMFLLYILLAYLLVIPTIIFFVFQFLGPEFAVAILLLAAIPPGASAPVLTDIFKGNASLSMAISLLANLISPFTILILFFVLTQTVIKINYINLFFTLVLINFLPLIVAQIIRRMNKPLIERTKRYYSLINIFFMSVVIYISISAQATEILKNPLNAFIDILWLYLLFILLFFISYFIAPWKSKNDKIAVSVTKTYMNNSLALGLATVFFTPKIVLLMILSEIPWGSTLGLFKYLLKYLK